MQIGSGEPVLQRYERVCFDKSFCNTQGQPQAALIAPGHPLLEATIDLVRERNADVLKRGTVFIDDSDHGTDVRLLFYVEDSVQDGVILPSGSKRVISKHIHFVELKEDGTAANAGYAPYLDYRGLENNEQEIGNSEREIVMAALPGIVSRFAHLFSTFSPLSSSYEEIAAGYAISEIIPARVKEVKERKTKLIDKTAKAVKERLTAEIQYWDFRAADLKTKESAGKGNSKLNSQMAQRRADELQARMQKRLAELETEKLISAMPPVIVGGAIVIPRGLLNRLIGRPDTFAADALARREVELAAMRAVIDIETSLGYTPRDVSADKRGYDIESQIPSELRDGKSPLRFIEVKGRAKDSHYVTVTKNEILTAFNKPNEYILAIVEVDGANTRTVYLKKPFHERPDFAATSVNYDIAEITKGAEILLKRGEW
jgi:hypothetical protein